MSTRLSNGLRALRAGCLYITCALALSACGGGGSSTQTAGIGGTGIAVGKVTNFGSIFVNGRKYNTDDSSFVVDGSSAATQDDLEIGMVVSVRVETENGELTSVATRVEYDDQVQGPVSGISTALEGSRRTFTVFGQTVTIDITGAVFKGTTFAALSNDDIVEISGFRTSPTTINATYVEKKGVFSAGTSEVELRGEIDLYAGGSTFEIDGTVINIDSLNTVIDVPGGVLVNGMFVEVEGVIRGDFSVDAAEIEFEDDVFGDDFDEVSLQGVISNYQSISDFEIDGLRINAAGAEISPHGAMLGNGVEVEVEGDLVGGELIADEVELRQGESRVEARIVGGSVDTIAGSFEVYYLNVGGTVVVKTNANTLFKDEISISPLPKLGLADLAMNDFVRVEGPEISGELVASIVKRIDGADEFRLEGAVDFFNLSLNQIEILGIRYTADGTAKYEEGTLTQTQFFGQLGVLGLGTLVEIEDDSFPFGVADEVEFED